MHFFVSVGSAFDANLEWSQQMRRSSWFDLKSPMTKGLIWGADYYTWINSDGKPLEQYEASASRRNLSSHVIFQGGRNSLFDVGRRFCVIYFCESLSVVRWALKTVWIVAICATQFACRNCQCLTWWTTPSRPNISHVLHKHHLLLQSLGRTHVSGWRLEGMWEPRILLP